MRNLFFTAALVFVSSQTGLAATITKQLSFDIKSPVDGRCRADQDCRPWGNSLPDYRKELHPVIPVRTLKVMLPAGQGLNYVRYEATQGTDMDYTPEMAGRQRVISLGYDTRPLVSRYAAGLYPAKLIGEPRVVSFRGFDFVEVPVYLFQMISPTKARFFNSIKIKVETTPVQRAPPRQNATTQSGEGF